MSTETEFPSSRCPECPLFTRLRYHVPATVVEGAKIAICGEAPGEREVAQRTGFVGPSGQLLDGLLRRAGIIRSQVTVTNVLKCQPLKNKLPDDLDLAIECCSEILAKDLKDVKVIIGLGNVPLKALTGYDGITRRRGSIYPLDTPRFEDKMFIGTIHPAALMRSQYVKGGMDGRKMLIPPKEIVVADLKKALNLSLGLIKIPSPTFTLYPTELDKQEFLALLENPDELVGVDIETTKEEKPEDCVPIIVAFSLADWVLVASFDDDLEFIVEAFKSNARKSIHNGWIFDVHVLETLGFYVNNYVIDTLYAHHLMYSELMHRLEFVQSLYTNLPFHKHLKSGFEELWQK